MNNKRQTIWLVSMLSLMVVLSAYYLFTEDAPSDKSKTTQSMEDAGKVSANSPDGLTITEEDPTADELTGAATGSAGKKDKGVQAADSGDTSKEDQEVLKGMTNLSGNERLDKIALDQKMRMSKYAEELETIIGNTKSSQEEATVAVEKHNQLEELDARITSLQEKLLQDFENAVVSEEQSNFKVIVLSDKLEKKQAIGIIDMATKELEVTPDRVTVEYVQ
ncbi:SpoIIIAH-like family protein [Cohnella terricola]|uniref:SpoIIIAH-like family protein n=1 Tax=Cohnella terricola TaxID=1289167 RepID=A0A559JXB7_9BACL|nr:SpoIIIAH-like family protein [Cohnella terricola]TVY04450.1 SpoIIIAH-like family protein [Cohnella terricola]